MNTLIETMSTIYVNDEPSNAQGIQGGYQNFEQVESCNSQRFQGGFNGGSGFAKNGERPFQQRSNFHNNMIFNGNNINLRTYSNFGNRSYGPNDSNGSNGSNESTDNNKGLQS